MRNYLVNDKKANYKQVDKQKCRKMCEKFKSPYTTAFWVGALANAAQPTTKFNLSGAIFRNLSCFLPKSKKFVESQQKKSWKVAKIEKKWTFFDLTTYVTND